MSLGEGKVCVSESAMQRPDPTQVTVHEITRLMVNTAPSCRADYTNESVARALAVLVRSLKAQRMNLPIIAAAVLSMSVSVVDLIT